MEDKPNVIHHTTISFIVFLKIALPALGKHWRIREKIQSEERKL